MPRAADVLRDDRGAESLRQLQAAVVRIARRRTRGAADERNERRRNRRGHTEIDHPVHGVTLDAAGCPTVILAQSQPSSPRVLTAFTETTVPGAVCGSAACGCVTA